MTRYILMLLLGLSSAAFAQFKLNGKVKPYAAAGNLYINIPAVYGFFEQGNINIPLAKSGAFSINLPVKGQKFATLNFQGSTHLLLLNANKTLTIELDATGKNLKLLGGTALPANNLIEQVNLTEYPSFLQDDRYARMDKNALTSQLLKPYLAARDRKIAIVNQSAVSPGDKKMIAAEIKYAAYNNLHELTDVGAENPATLNKFVADIYAKTTIKPEVMPAGPQYYNFVSNYLQEVEKKTSGKSFNLLQRWETAIKYLPPNVNEQFGYQLLLRAFYNGDATPFKALKTAYLNKFPAGVYAADIKKKAELLK